MTGLLFGTGFNTVLDGPTYIARADKSSAVPPIGVNDFIYKPNLASFLLGQGDVPADTVAACQGSNLSFCSSETFSLEESVCMISHS
jgi:hypothetical protein